MTAELPVTKPANFREREYDNRANVGIGNPKVYISISKTVKK
jgi:hypothetical protein